MEINEQIEKLKEANKTLALFKCNTDGLDEIISYLTNQEYHTSKEYELNYSNGTDIQISYQYNKLYFIRPKPEVSFQDMGNCLIITNSRERCWDLFLLDNGTSIYEQSDYDDYFISDEFELKNKTEEMVVWGCNDII